jgi:hypothetical protein
MREALASPDYFGRYLAGSTWDNWRVLLIAIMGEPLTDAEMVAFQALTGRDSAPVDRIREFWGIIGRRGGKSRAMAVLAAYVGGCCDHRAVLAPGERGVLPVLAASTVQAKSIFNLIRGVFEAVPRLRSLVEGENADTLSLSSQVDISVRPASFRTIRSISAVSAIGDEVAFWRDAETSANPDVEVISALRPSLLTTGGIFVGISSPYAQRGSVFDAYRRHFGPKGDARRLVAKAASIVMNPGLPREEIDQAYLEDPARAAAEFGAEFRQDIEAYIARETLERLVSSEVEQRSPVPGLAYRAFVDMSGGSSDSAALAIAHQDGIRVILDAAVERKAPHSPESVTEEFAKLLKRYDLSTVTGDAYAGLYPREAFGRHGITYKPAERSKSQIYVDLLPRLNSAEVVLLDLPPLVDQLASLERRTARGGRDTIDHPPNGRDDLANAVAGALTIKSSVVYSTSDLVGHYSGPFHANRSGYRTGPPSPFTQDRRPPLPEWVQRGLRYPPGDFRWKLEDGQKWLAANNMTIEQVNQ